MRSCGACVTRGRVGCVEQSGSVTSVSLHSARALAIDDGRPKVSASRANISGLVSLKSSSRGPEACPEGVQERAVQERKRWRLPLRRQAGSKPGSWKAPLGGRC